MITGDVIASDEHGLRQKLQVRGLILAAAKEI
jgi:hypothetical protein